jgi:hypothetical protein
MKRIVGIFLIFAFATVKTAGAAEAARTHEDSNREAPVAASSNLAARPLPQLAANTNTAPEVPMVEEKTNLSAALPAAPATAQPRNTLWMVLAVLAVVAGSYLLQRLRSRSGPS